MQKVKKTEKHKIANIESKITTSNIEIENIEGFLKERLYFTDYFDDKKLTKLIKNIERQIRKSDEYSSWIGHLHEIGLNQCAIWGNIIGSKTVTIEIHHYPYTLYDIVYYNIMDKILREEKFNSMNIIESVLDDHFDNIISCVPVCKTVHKLSHLGQIFIPLDSCFGDLNSFNEKYYECFDDETIEKFNELVEMTEEEVVYNEEDILALNEKYKDIELTEEEYDKANMSKVISIK